MPPTIPATIPRRLPVSARRRLRVGPGLTGLGLTATPAAPIAAIGSPTWLINPASASLAMTQAQIGGCTAGNGTPSAGLDVQGRTVGTCSVVSADASDVSNLLAWCPTQGGYVQTTQNALNSGGAPVTTCILPYNPSPSVAPAANAVGGSGWTPNPATAATVMSQAQINACQAGGGTPSAGINAAKQTVGTCSCLLANHDAVVNIQSWGPTQGGYGQTVQSNGQSLYVWLLAPGSGVGTAASTSSSTSSAAVAVGGVALVALAAYFLL